jgi:hypothetical protein
VTLPQELRQELITKLASVILKAQEVYRDKSQSDGFEITEGEPPKFDELLIKLLTIPSFSRGKNKTASRLSSLYQKASIDERLTLTNLVYKLINISAKLN